MAMWRPASSSMCRSREPLYRQTLFRRSARSSPSARSQEALCATSMRDLRFGSSNGRAAIPWKSVWRMQMPNRRPWSPPPILRRRMIVAHALLTGAVKTFAQSVAFVVAPHPPAPLQLRHDKVDEIAEARRRHDVDQIEALDVGFLDPLLEPVGGRGRGGDHRRVGSALVKFARMPWMPGVSEYSSGWSRSSFEISTWVMPLKRARLPSID